MSVTAAEDAASSQLMAVAMAAMDAVGIIEQQMQQHANGAGWQGM